MSLIGAEKLIAEMERLKAENARLCNMVEQYEKRLSFLEADNDKLLEKLEESESKNDWLRHELDKHATIINSMVSWLEKNKNEVWREGIWDAINSGERARAREARKHWRESDMDLIERILREAVIDAEDEEEYWDVEEKEGRENYLKTTRQALLDYYILKARLETL